MDWRDHLTSGLVARAMGYPVIGRPAAVGVPNDLILKNLASNHSPTFNQCSTAVNRRDTAEAVGKHSLKLQTYIDYVTAGSRVKPGLRPIYPCSKKNTDTFDRQEQRDLQKFIAAGHKYWAQLNKPYHHHYKADLSCTRCPEDHVYADRGRHKPEWCRSSSIFDPITSSSRPIGSPDKHRAELRPRSAPRCRTSSDSAVDDETQQERLFAQKRPGSARTIQGRYNPLTHTWIDQPDAAAHATRQKHADRMHGMIGIRTCNSPYSPNRDTGTAQVLQLDTQSLQQSSSAVTDTVGTTAASVGAAACQSLDHKSSVSSSSGSRRCQSAPRMVRDHGDSWGTYDCLRHKWISPPNNKRYISREAAPGGVSFDGGSRLAGVKKVPLPPSQGVYNPITCQWQVLPSNRKSAEGLSFAPARMFREKAYTSR